MRPDGVRDLTEIWNQDFLGGDASFQQRTPLWEIRCMPLIIYDIQVSQKEGLKNN